MKNENGGRRAFLKACGVVATTAALPAAAAPAVGSGPAAHIPALSEWYARELERFLQEHEAELRAGTMGDSDWPPNGDWIARFNRLEEAVAERFGLHESDFSGAHLVAAVAHSAEEVDDGAWHHPAYLARAAVTEDVLRAAEARGWIERAE